MGNQVYSRNEFIIIRVKKGFVIINKKKHFKDGHTHIKSFGTAKYLIDRAIKKQAPNHLSKRMLVSLIRITDDDEFRNKVQALLDNKNNRKQQYRRSA